MQICAAGWFCVNRKQHDFRLQMQLWAFGWTASRSCNFKIGLCPLHRTHVPKVGSEFRLSCDWLKFLVFVWLVCKWNPNWWKYISITCSFLCSDLPLQKCIMRPQQWRVQRGGAVGAAASYWLIFCSKKPLFRVNGISLCAFAINKDGANKLSSAPFSKFLDPPLAATASSIFLLHVCLRR